jgi:hypothetical protein
MWRVLLSAGIALILGGCATGPLLENPLHLRPDRAVAHENPLYIPGSGGGPQGELAYARVFDKVLDVLSDYFELAYHNRYDGRIETHPSIAPGIEQPWKPGSPDCYQRLLAFCQTIRHRAIVVITTADDGGYFIDVKVYKELEDLPRPTRATAGDATFRLESTVQRQFEVIEADLFEPAWIPIGRDCKLEQCILDRLSRFDAAVPCH